MSAVMKGVHPFVLMGVVKNGLDSHQKLWHCEWLGEINGCSCQSSFELINYAITPGENHTAGPCKRRLCFDSAVDFIPIHFGEAKVNQHEIGEPRLRQRQPLHCLETIWKCPDLIAPLCQRCLNDIAHGRRVVNQENM